jgi:hypothetical protein
LALTGPKIFLGLHVKNWNTPMDAINTKVNVRVEYVMGYTFYTKLGRITPLLTLSNYPSPGLSNPKNTNTFGLNINYHYLRWISGFGVRKSDLASFHTQLGYEFKSLTVMYNVGISPIASTVLEGNRSTFHQMTAQWNLFPSKKEKLPYYFLDHFDYPNGKLKILKLYNYGQLIEIEKFHDNGELMESMHFKDGLLNGEYSFSNKSGDSTISGQYINGKKYGEWMKCISNPPDLSDYEVTYNYLNDLLHGEYYIEKEGDILVEGMYHMGYKHGEWLYFNKNGKHIKTEKYSEGVLVE